MFDNYYDEYDEELVQIDEKLDELKQLMIQQTEKDVRDKINSLENRVKSMQATVDAYYDLQRKYAELEKDCATKIAEVKKKISDDLYEELGKEVYCIRYRNMGMKEKCDKCDSDRKLWYTTPLGRKVYEMCPCSKEVYKFVVEPAEERIYSGKLNDGKPILHKVKVGAYNYIDVGLNYQFGEYKDISDFDYLTLQDIKYGICDWLFKTEECAQEWADAFNKKFCTEE